MKEKALYALARTYNYLRRDERGQGHTVEILGGLFVAGLAATLLYTQWPTIRNGITNWINCAVNHTCQ